MPGVRYVKAVMAGLGVGLLFAIAVTTIEFLFAWRSVSFEMTKCADSICFGYARVGGLEMPIAFAVGFGAAFAWTMRRRRLPGL